MAYIDPGTAGQVFSQGGSMVIAFLAGALGIIGLFFRRIVAFFRKNPKVACTLGAAGILVTALVVYWLSRQ